MENGFAVWSYFLRFLALVRLGDIGSGSICCETVTTMCGYTREPASIRSHLKVDLGFAVGGINVLEEHIAFGAVNRAPVSQAGKHYSV